MPQALQAKTAREMDRRNTLGKSLLTPAPCQYKLFALGKAFALWRKLQKKKIEHKAIKYVLHSRPCSYKPS